MLRKGAVILLLFTAISLAMASAQNAKIWASKSYVLVTEDIELNLFWSDTGCPEYHVILLRTYPNGTTSRYPAEGYGEALRAPGVTPIKMKLKAEAVGKHLLKYELYCGTTHVDTSNQAEVVVLKGNSSIELRVVPEKLVKGGEVRIEGSINPSVSGKATLELVSPSGSRRNVSLEFEGNFSYSTILNETGTWRFRASWSGNRDYYGSSSDWIKAEVVEKPFRVKISTNPPGLTVYVDGKAYEGGGEFEWIAGSFHNLTAESEVVQSGKRYLFTGWRGIGNSASVQVEAGKSEVYIADYRVQYYLEVVSNFSEAEGSGWYDEGSLAKARIKRSEVEGNFPWIYVFSGWGGDASGSGLDSDPILMDGPKRAVANWERRLNQTFLILLVAAAMASISVAASIYLALKYRRLRREVMKRRRGPSIRVKEDERIRRIREKISRLEEMRKRGEIPETVYQKLRREYLADLKRISEEREKRG